MILSAIAEKLKRRSKNDCKGRHFEASLILQAVSWYLRYALSYRDIGDRREIGGAMAVGYFRARSLTEGGCVAWVLRLVEIGAEGEGPCADVVEISRPDGLVDIANLGLTLAEAKLVLASVQREIVAAQARDHAVRRLRCRCCKGVCRVKGLRGPLSHNTR